MHAITGDRLVFEIVLNELFDDGQILELYSRRVECDITLNTCMLVSEHALCGSQRISSLMKFRECLKHQLNPNMILYSEF